MTIADEYQINIKQEPKTEEAEEPITEELEEAPPTVEATTSGDLIANNPKQSSEETIAVVAPIIFKSERIDSDESLASPIDSTITCPDAISKRPENTEKEREGNVGETIDVPPA